MDSKTSKEIIIKDIRPNDYLFPIRLTDSSLAEIEYNLQVSPEWHFKKKLGAILEQEKAYNILKCYRSSGKEQSTFKIYLDKYVELTDLDKAIILQQVKATQETINLAVGKFEIITDLEIIMPEPEQSCMIE